MKVKALVALALSCITVLFLVSCSGSKASSATAALALTQQKQTQQKASFSAANVRNIADIVGNVANHTRFMNQEVLRDQSAAEFETEAYRYIISVRENTLSINVYSKYSRGAPVVVMSDAGLDGVVDFGDRPQEVPSKINWQFSSGKVKPPAGQDSFQYWQSQYQDHLQKICAHFNIAWVS